MSTDRQVMLLIPTKAEIRDWVRTYRGPPGTIVDHLHAAMQDRAHFAAQTWFTWHHVQALRDAIDCAGIDVRVDDIEAAYEALEIIEASMPEPDPQPAKQGVTEYHVHRSDIIESGVIHQGEARVRWRAPQDEAAYIDSLRPNTEHTP